MLRKSTLATALIAAALPLSSCTVGPTVNGSFDRTLDVSSPLRVELSNASGDIRITGSADGKVHIHGDVRSSGFLFNDPKRELADTLSNPPIEQKGTTVRIGKQFNHVRGTAIDYVIEVPHDTEISSSIASGSQTIRNIRGPVKADAASGSIRVENIERDVQISAASGSIDASNIGNDLRVNAVSGNFRASNVKGDVRSHAVSGSCEINNPGGRVETDTMSGTIDIRGAQNDVRAHGVSGQIIVAGNPGTNNYWDLKTVSGSLEIHVPPSANFHLSAEATSGQIRTDVPIVIEEQGKHSLRAHLGTNGGRVEIRTMSGSINVRPSS